MAVSRTVYDLDSEGQPLADAVKRDSFKEFFRWVPQWEAEVSLATTGLERSIWRAKYLKSSIVLGHLANAKKYMNEANDDLDGLKIAFTPETSNVINYETIRDDKVCMTALAKHLLFKRSLQEFSWPKHTRPTLNRKLSPITEMLQTQDDIQLRQTWVEAHKSAQGRADFWLDQRLQVVKNPVAELALDVVRAESVVK